MSTNKIDHGTTLAIAAAVLAMVLAACNQASQPELAAPSPAAAPTAKPVAASMPAPASEPAVESMHAATPSAKMSVAADLKYQFDGEVVAGQPVTLHLAVIPRVAGSNLNVSIKQVAGIEVAASPLNVQKATASGVYRQQLSLTKSAAAPANLRILVTMDMAEGKAFGFFSVPLDGGTIPQKQDSVKAR